MLFRVSGLFMQGAVVWKRQLKTEKNLIFLSFFFRKKLTLELNHAMQDKQYFRLELRQARKCSYSVRVSVFESKGFLRLSRFTTNCTRERGVTPPRSHRHRVFYKKQVSVLRLSSAVTLPSPTRLWKISLELGIHCMGDPSGYAILQYSTKTWFCGWSAFWKSGLVMQGVGVWKQFSFA